MSARSMNAKGNAITHAANDNVNDLQARYYNKEKKN